MARLEIVSGEASGTTFQIQGETVLGREKYNPVYIPDARVSRKHGKITFKSQSYYFQDLDSKNGSLLNGEPVEQAKLSDGDRIQVGNTELVFTVEGDRKSGGSSGSDQKPKQRSSSDEEASVASAEPLVEERNGSSSDGTSPPGGKSPEQGQPGARENPSNRAVRSGRSTGLPGWLSFLIGLIALGVVFGLSYFGTMKILPLLF